MEEGATHPAAAPAGFDWRRTGMLLLLAATETAALPGISAAGATPASRRQTAAADAELLWLGPAARRPHALPPLPAGVSPALISHAVLRELDLRHQLQVVDLGCAVAPAIPHLRLPGLEGAGPAACLSTGRAMEALRVRALVARGRRWGRRWVERWGCSRPLLLAECVPGGTSTAQAVLQGLGVEAAGLVSGSLRQPAHQRKTDLAAAGLARGLGQGQGRPAPAVAVLAAVGDPMQALAAGLVVEAGAAGVPLLLAGGSQMAAELALALALAAPAERAPIAAAASVATTAWVAQEPHSDLALLLERLGARWGVQARLAVAGLRFHGCASQALRDYERGFVKEGVGAGGLAVLWQRLGRDPQDLAQACDLLCGQLGDPL